MDSTVKESRVNKTAIITGVICLLVGLIIGMFAQQLLSQRAKCDTPVQVNLPNQNPIQ